MVIVGIFGWIVAGLIVGLIASKFVNLRGDDPRLGIGVAAGAAVVAAIIYTVVSGAGISGFNVWSLLWAAVGAVVGSVVWHAVRSRSISHEQYVPRKSY